MIRYTTPTLILEVNKDLTDVDVYVSLKDNSNEVSNIKITSDQMHVCDDTTKIYLTLTQEMTGNLKSGTSIKMQINWINSLGVREATECRTVSVTDNLFEEVISYGE